MTLYRFELQCGCFGTLNVLKYSDIYYAYDSTVDYGPRHIHVGLHPEGCIRTTTEPDIEALKEDICITMTQRDMGISMKGLERVTCGDNRYHKRVWRPGQETPDTYSEGYTDATTAFVSIQSDLIDLLRVIEPHSNNHKAYGHATRELLLLACTEVELMWRSVLVCNGYQFANPSRASTNDYVKVLTPLKLDQWAVKLIRYNDYPEIVPFAGWDAAQATQSLSWYAAYNAAKHDRVANFHEATLKAVLDSMAALFVLLVAQFGIALEQAHIGIAPDMDEQRVFYLVRRPTFALTEQYAFDHRASKIPVNCSF